MQHKLPEGQAAVTGPVETRQTSLGAVKWLKLVQAGPTPTTVRHCNAHSSTESEPS